MILRERAYPRAGLIGNPSDGFHGKTISFTFSNFAAEVVLYPSPALEILPNARDRALYEDVPHLVRNIRKYGYYGGVRLLQAGLKRFWEYCRAAELEIHDRPTFSLRYHTNIPHQVGLAGSSAIITACMRALMRYFDVAIPPERLASLVLAVETEELGIAAGLQDRVAQAYEGLVAMDFAREIMERDDCGAYERLDAALLPPLYIAYLGRLSECSEVFHSDLRTRFQMGEPAVLAAMRFWAELSDRFRAALEAGDRDELGGLIDANFDRRASLCRIHPDNLRLVEAARAVGASAKFTGSGGAIVGIYEDEDMFARLVESLAPLGVQVFKPQVI